MRSTLKLSLAAAAACVAAFASPALAQATSSATSGGPGTLGTEVPYDSPEAPKYLDYSLPVSGARDAHIQQGIQKLHADHQVAITLARMAEVNGNAKVKEWARKFAAEQGLVDQNLIETATNEGFSITGPVFEKEKAAQQGWVAQFKNAPASAREATFFKDVQGVGKTAAYNASRLERWARHAQRLILANTMKSELKSLEARIDSAEMA
jgi:hypothetical protein